jgi:hypothetical protein
MQYLAEFEVHEHRDANDRKEAAENDGRDHQPDVQLDLPIVITNWAD